MTLHPLVKRLLDGEIQLADLPPEVRSEGERALRLLSGVDRDPVSLSPELEDRVLSDVRGRVVTLERPWWRRLIEPREGRLRLRPWLLGFTLAGLAGLVALLDRSGSVVGPVPGGADSASVRFVFYAPEARVVTVAGSFNDWSLTAAPLARADSVWTITLSLPAGQHEYAFVVDGRRWMTDPAAPAVDDGLGHRNSLVAVGPGARIL